MKPRHALLSIICFLFQARVAFAESGSPHEPIEFEAGRSTLGRLGDFFNSGTGKIFSANWLEIRFHPFLSANRWEGLGFQLGAHQSDDMTKGTACRLAPEIAGRRYCSTADFELDQGAQFTAVFAGIQTELVQLIGREPRPVRVFVGGGGTYLRSVLFTSRTRPYLSVEFASESEKRFQAKAGLFLSPIHQDEELGAAFPEVTLQYRF